MRGSDLINIVNKYSREDEYDFNGFLMYKDEVVAEIRKIVKKFVTIKQYYVKTSMYYIIK